MSVASVLAGEKLERVKRFQQKAVRAKVVIVLITKDYTGSKTSEQQVGIIALNKGFQIWLDNFSLFQVFYCEHRKHVVLVKCDDHTIPCWFSSLMGNDVISVSILWLP